MPGKVRVIPANTNEPMKHVVIYARVSSNTMDQLESLTKKFLVGVFIHIARLYDAKYYLGSRF